MCEYVENEGYYSDWTGEYFETHNSCVLCSSVQVFGEEIVMNKSDFLLISGTFGALMAVLIVWAWLKAIL